MIFQDKTVLFLLQILKLFLVNSKLFAKSDSFEVAYKSIKLVKENKSAPHRRPALLAGTWYPVRGTVMLAPYHILVVPYHVLVVPYHALVVLDMSTGLVVWYDSLSGRLHYSNR